MPDKTNLEPTNDLSPKQVKTHQRLFGKGARIDGSQGILSRHALPKPSDDDIAHSARPRSKAYGRDVKLTRGR